MAAPQALTPEQIQQIIAAGQGGSVNIGGTIYQPQFAQLGGGEGGSLGGLENIYGYTPEQNKVGGTYNQYDPTGAFTRSGTQQEVNANKDFLKFLAGSALTFALPGALSGSLFGTGAAGAAGSEAFAGEALADAGLLAGGTGAAATTGLTAAQIANLAKAGISVAGLLGAGNAISNAGGGTTTAAGVSIPTQGTPQYNADYFSRVQGAYNQALPGMPRDVVSNLAAWYGGDAGMMSGADTANTAIAKQVTKTPTKLVDPMTSLMNAYRSGNVADTKKALIGALNAGMTTEQLMSTFNLGMKDIDYLRGQGYYLPAMTNEIKDVVGQELKNPATAYANIVAKMDATGTNPAAVAAALGLSTEEVQNAYNQLNPTGLFASNNPNFGAVDAGLLYNVAANPADYQTAIQEIQKYRAADEVGQQSVVEKALAAELAARPGSSLSALQQAGSTYGVSAADIAAAYAKLGYA
jgi:uncharacterized protein (DUF433 family)